ncbi:hypothetical protein N656DRAFT_762612 [Canariomyces notabilis]|uniref:RRM domain-containing protein n=1 Tax=Canariomyces notabilis TaxID=2074819 RepID=A0AAN6QCW7_9PEZI|nr:hypothetical protein N656DRAFT_762612 [Canariomyces arenarius]
MNQFTDPINTIVLVGGLSGYVSEDELRSFFQGPNIAGTSGFAGFGRITYAKIPPGKGCGFVQFVHRHAAEMAINQTPTRRFARWPSTPGRGIPNQNARTRLGTRGTGTRHPFPPPRNASSSWISLAVTVRPGMQGYS